MNMSGYDMAAGQFRRAEHGQGAGRLLRPVLPGRLRRSGGLHRPVRRLHHRQRGLDHRHVRQVHHDHGQNLNLSQEGFIVTAGLAFGGGLASVIRPPNCRTRPPPSTGSARKR